MKKNKAFTLVELIVIIVILCILTAVIVPSLAKVRKVAYEQRQKSSQVYENQQDQHKQPVEDQWR